MVTYDTEPSSLPPLLNKARSLVQAGYEAEVICHTERPDQPRREHHRGGFEVTRIYSRTRRFFRWAYGPSPQSTIAAFVQYFCTYLEYSLRVIGAALKSPANLFEAHDLPTLPATLVASRMRRRPILYHAHEIWAEVHRDVRFGAFWKALERSLVPFVDTVVTPEENRSRIMKDEAGARRMPLTIMNCPPYRLPQRTDRLREELLKRGIAARFIVLYQGLFDDERCITELIAASGLFTDGIVLVLIGSGYGAYADLRPLIPDPGRVVVLARVPYDELYTYTASADLGVLLYRNTCRNNYYCAPNKIHEYMMMGLPVVANDYPGIAKLVTGERVGLAVDCENPGQIAEAVNRLADQQSTCQEFRENALRLARDRYNWEHEFEKLRAEYARLLGPAGDFERAQGPAGRS